MARRAEGSGGISVETLMAELLPQAEGSSIPLLATGMRRQYFVAFSHRGGSYQRTTGDHRCPSQVARAADRVHLTDEDRHVLALCWNIMSLSSVYTLAMCRPDSASRASLVTTYDCPWFERVTKLGITLSQNIGADSLSSSPIQLASCSASLARHAPSLVSTCRSDCSTVSAF